MAKGKQKLAVLERAISRQDPAGLHDAPADGLAGVPSGAAHVATAVVEDITPDGIALIVLTGEERAREAASVLRFSSARAAADALLGRTVIVALEGAAPVILGVVAQRLWDTGEGAGEEAVVSLPAASAMPLPVGQQRLDLEASDEIRLSCGKSSLVLRRDGTVIVRGVKIVSRASQSNKIRGATVSLN